jgi:hypothetical protein
MKFFQYTGITAMVWLLVSCGGSDFQKNPVDNLIRDMTNAHTFSVILYDMNVDGTFFKDYQHQYRIIKQSSEEAEPTEEITDWYTVSEDFFAQNENNMGMELAAKNAEGKISKTAAPPGYNNYVGNPKYGQWQGSGANSFWAFYGQYALLSNLLNMGTFPARRSYYDDYTSNRGSGRPYYGPRTSDGRTTYGTNSTYTSRARPNSTWSRTTSSRGFRTRSSTSTSRSGSRYSGSSSRSRGGGFGK